MTAGEKKKSQQPPILGIWKLMKMSCLGNRSFSDCVLSELCVPAGAPQVSCWLSQQLTKLLYRMSDWQYVVWCDVVERI